MHPYSPEIIDLEVDNFHRELNRISQKRFDNWVDSYNNRKTPDQLKTEHRRNIGRVLAAVSIFVGSYAVYRFGEEVFSTDEGATPAATLTSASNDCVPSKATHLEYLTFTEGQYNGQQMINDMLKLPGASNCSVGSLVMLAESLNPNEPLPNDSFTSGLYKLPNEVSKH
jgi:hypothetical protein